MQLIEQFRVQGPNGEQHTVACYQGSYERPKRSGWEQVLSVRHYRLNGSEQIQRINEDTFMTESGVVLRRHRRS
jgi:hypothetical protein